VRLISLSSGSSGNCYLLQSKEGHNVLIDCGLTASKVQEYLARFGVPINELSAIFLTHDHGDHLRGAGTISQRYGVPVYANTRTLEEARKRWEKIRRVQEQHVVQHGGSTRSTKDESTRYNTRLLPTGEVASFGSLEVSSFPVSHDAADTVCYTFREDDSQATILTDLGCATDPIFEPLYNSDLIVLEANHDVERLQASRYPYSLKARIFGDRGHLSNLQSAEILRKVIERSSPAHTIWLAHLSEENNHPDIAKKQVGNHLENCGIRKFPLNVARRDKPSLEWNGEPARYQMQMF
jgi:phosphoribosyl 1,2-cyclic phosphodiesterase